MVGKLLANEEMADGLMKAHPIIEMCLESLLGVFALGGSLDFELIQMVCFMLSNYVCSIDGCFKCVDNDWAELVFLIACKYNHLPLIRK